MLLIILTIITCSIVSLVFLTPHKNEKPQKIFNVYSQPGKWYYLKYYTFLLILTLRRLKFIIFGKKMFFSEKELERMQALSDHAKAFDAVFFQAVTQDGFYLCGGTERRQEAKINGLFYIQTPDHGLLLSKKLPNTELNADPASVYSLKEYSAEGICFTPVEPMKHWKVAFNGKMHSQKDPQKTFEVKLEANWTSNLPWFLFDVDLPSKVIARAVAKEEWNKKLFESLKEAHQTHYEQMGVLNGTLTIDDRVYEVKMDAFRDHSFGHKRDWTLMHRYIFHMFYLEDGTKISVGVVSQPCTTSHLEMGYIVHPNKNINAIESCNLQLYKFGENGTPLSEIGFIFVANRVEYEVKVKYEVEAVHYVGGDKDAKMHERFITCEVNGVKGRGISEWHYNNVK